jgi:hypothetical protein
MLIRTETNFRPLDLKASAKGASSDRRLNGTIPVITKHTPMYNAIHTKRLPIMPIGKSR